MTLRVRLAVIAVAVVLPLLAVSAWAQVYLMDQAYDQSTAALVLAHMQAQGREACEAAPEVWSNTPERRVLGGPPPFPPGPGRRPPPDRRPPPGPGRGPPPGRRPPGGPPDLRFYAYDARLQSANPAAPKLDVSLIEALSGEVTYAIQTPAPRVRDVAVRMPWSEGPCAVVMARRSVPPPSLWLLETARFWALPTAALVLALLWAMGPIAQRLRRLAASVRSSARAGYQVEVSVNGTDEIADLARAFDEAGREIRTHLQAQAQRERTLREFVENTTHDTMIPLTVLQGHLADLREGVATGRPPSSQVVDGAIREAHYMGSLLHNLTIAAKLESGEPERALSPVDLSSLLERAVSRHAMVARQQGVQLQSATPEEPVSALGDVTLLEQALSNVVYNAVRYNREGGHVAVTLEASPQTFTLRVVDDGPGLPDEELSRLTERYFRGNAARTRAPGGTGLGLSIAFRVAQRHGFALKLGRSEYGGLQVEFSGPRLPAGAT